MTELIVALDSPSNQYALACDLIEHANVHWFKVGPQLTCSYDWQEFTHSAKGFPNEIKIFLDLKLADTADTVREAVRRFADAGISAVSTSTYEATSAAMEATFHYGDLQVWQLMRLTEDTSSWIPGQICTGHGVICPGDDLDSWKDEITIVPGVRLNNLDDFHGHHLACLCEDIAGIADFAVVGRPIWSAANPIAAAKLYKAALESHH